MIVFWFCEVGCMSHVTLHIRIFTNNFVDISISIIDWFRDIMSQNMLLSVISFWHLIALYMHLIINYRTIAADL